MANQIGASSNPHQLIRIKDVLSLLAISRTTLSRLRERDSTFPKPIKDGCARGAPAYFVLAEVEGWVQRRMDQRDQTDYSGAPHPSLSHADTAVSRTFR